MYPLQVIHILEVNTVFYLLKISKMPLFKNMFDFDTKHVLPQNP